MIKGMMAVTDIVPDREAVKTGLDYSMHGMLAHNDEDDEKVSKSDELA